MITKEKIFAKINELARKNQEMYSKDYWSKQDLEAALDEAAEVCEALLEFLKSDSCTFRLAKNDEKF
jgi:hypothetical protein